MASPDGLREALTHFAALLERERVAIETRDASALTEIAASKQQLAQSIASRRIDIGDDAELRALAARCAELNHVNAVAVNAGVARLRAVLRFLQGDADASETYTAGGSMNPSAAPRRSLAKG